MDIDIDICIFIFILCYIYTRHIPKTLNSIQPKPYTLKGSHAQKTPTNLCTALLGHDAPDGEVRLCSRISISGRKDLVLRFREILAIFSLGFWVRPGTWQDRDRGTWALGFGSPGIGDDGFGAVLRPNFLATLGPVHRNFAASSQAPQQ